MLATILILLAFIQFIASPGLLTMIFGTGLLGLTLIVTLWPPRPSR